MKKTTAIRMPVLKVFFGLILLASILLTAGGLYGLIDPESRWMGFRAMDKILTKASEIFTYAAVILLVWKLLWRGSQKLKLPFTDFVRKIWAFFYTRHILFGWIVTAAAVAHSVYFLVFLPRSMTPVYSGLIALGVMAVLVVLGVFLDKKARGNKTIRMAHTVLGVLFMAGLFYHLGTAHEGHGPRTGHPPIGS
ncbi:hypothetical protein [Brevibacillus dissolubilis]|uniref:hypothetical protein n=1 Tax=Brevibacillus dissolubilis TaxID=1844116 RepID=UPI0011161FE8|nr:hypothetical protein [Brevibacillus dissolubilis]